MDSWWDLGWPASVPINIANYAMSDNPIWLGIALIGSLIVVFQIAGQIAGARGYGKHLSTPTPLKETVHKCVTCGSPVEVVTSDEGTSYYRTIHR